MTFFNSLSKANFWKGLILTMLMLGLVSGCLYDEAANTCFDFAAEGEETGKCASDSNIGSSSVVIISVSPADEVAVLLNQSLVDQKMDGWTLGPDSALAEDQYIFGVFTLGVGGVVRIHKGTGTEADTGTDLYWEGDDHWVSDDTAHLKDSTGTIIDTCNNSDPCWGG